MAELTTLEEKLAEVIGLAKAAQEATEKVEGMLDDDELASQLRRQREEAAETERRGTELADQRDGKRTAILENWASSRRRPASPRSRSWWSGPCRSRSATSRRRDRGP